MLRLKGIRRPLLGSAVLVSWASAAPRAPIDPIDFRLVGLEDSSGYLVYRYTATNPSTSTQGVASFRLDVSASPGTPSSSLPATGPVLNGPALTSPVPVAPHAEIGPISPSNWQAGLDRSTAMLDWWGVNGRIFNRDSIAPGDSLPGLGIRSTFLPAIRSIGGMPTWQACCQEPWGTEEENPLRMNPDPEDFIVTSWAIAPGHRGEEITIDLLQSQLRTLCSDPPWLDDRAACAELGSSLARASSRLAEGDRVGLAEALTYVREKVDARRASMEPEAYWLLYYNVRQALANIVAPLDGPS